MLSLFFKILIAVYIIKANKDITNAKVMSELKSAFGDGGQYSKILTE